MDNVKWVVRKGGHSGKSNGGINFYLKRLQGLENGKVTLQCNVITEFNQRLLSFRNLKVQLNNMQTTLKLTRSRNVPVIKLVILHCGLGLRCRLSIIHCMNVEFAVNSTCNSCSELEKKMLLVWSKCLAIDSHFTH